MREQKDKKNIYKDFRVQEMPWEIEKEYAKRVLDMLPFLHLLMSDQKKSLVVN